MPHLSGVFESLKGLSNATADNISRWLEFRVEIHTLENFLANRIIYPQTIPLSSQELDIDLAILREGIRLNSNLFLNSVKSEILIPQEFLVRFPDTKKLITSFADALSLKETSRIFIKDNLGKRSVGGILTLPSLISGANQFLIGVKKYALAKGSLTVIPLKDKLSQVIINGTSQYPVYGGREGLYIDLRDKLK